VLAYTYVYTAVQKCRPLTTVSQKGAITLTRHFETANQFLKYFSGRAVYFNRALIVTQAPAAR